MAKEIVYPPLVHWKSLLKGIFGGSLLVGGLANPSYGMIIQAILVLFGLVALLDGIMITAKGVFIVICLISAIIAGVVTLVLSATGAGTAYLVAIFILMMFLYLRAYIRQAGRVPVKRPHEAAQE